MLVRARGCPFQVPVFPSGDKANARTKTVRDRIHLISNSVVTSHMSDPAAARGQAVMALEQTIENQASIVSFSDVIAVLGAVLVLAAFYVLVTRHRRLRPARASRRTESPNIFDEYRAKSVFLG